MSTSSAQTWTSWSGLAQSRPRTVVRPTSPEEVADAVVVARDAGLRVKMPGSGHSFTDIAVTDGVLLDPTGLTGIVGLDREAMTVTVLAGTTLRQLNAALDVLGLALHNMGDVDPQTLAGAISTGTHGTGGVAAGLAAQVAGFELVTGTGELVSASREENAELFELGRVGLGALGILTTVTFDVEPAFVLEAHEQPMSWDEALASFDRMADESHHCDMYWFPHTDRMLTKRNTRLDA